MRLGGLLGMRKKGEQGGDESGEADSSWNTRGILLPSMGSIVVGDGENFEGLRRIMSEGS